MRILAVSDKRSPSLYDYYSEGKLSGFDLILGCGDLDGDYLEYLMTMANCPLVYVHGNHDDNRSKEPLGCICADFKVVEAAGLRIFGLPGSYKYRDGKYMYSERRMKRKILQKWPGLMMKGGFDILLTHAPYRTAASSASICFSTDSVPSCSCTGTFTATTPTASLSAPTTTARWSSTPAITR